MKKNRDERYLDKLRDYYALHGVLPSFATIRDLVGLGTTSAVAAMVVRMKKKEFLQSTPDRRLQPGRRLFESVVLETVQTGPPQPAMDPNPTALDIGRRLIKMPSQTVLLKVRGESMLDAGLLPNDVVVVNKGQQPTVGEIVVAVVDRNYTIKYFAEDDTGYYLKAGNKEYKDIRPKEPLEIFGVVTGSFREYTASRHLRLA